MTNQTISTAPDYSVPGRITLRGATTVYWFPYTGPVPVGLDQLRVELGGKLDQLLRLVGQLTTATPLPAQTPATDPRWLANQLPVAGATITLPEGVELGGLHFAVSSTVIGAGMRRTVLDGQGGIGSGHRLPWGKGIEHVGAGPHVTQDVGFKGGGGGDGVSDLEAGFYAEGFDGTALLLRCAFDACENGVAVPAIGLAPVDLVIDRCVFGRLARNGLPDGKSHNLYVAGRSVVIRDSVLFGSESNTIKCRGPKLTVTGSHVERYGNRWIDTPGGTDVVTSGNTFVTPPGTDVQNAIGLFDEGDTGANPGRPGSWSSTGDRFYFSRWNEVIWINNADTVVQFTDARVFWIGAKGATPPTVTIQGPGKITGVNPFTFNETNRVDAAPAAPADPA